MKTKSFDRNFVLVVIGQVISILGAAVLRFALNLYVLDITGRADLFALVLSLSTIPVIFFTPIGGAIADRFNRRNLMVIFDFANSGVVLLLCLLLFSGVTSVVLIALVMMVLSVISAMYQPVVQASIPSLVPADGLARANGIVSGVGALSGVLGPALGMMLYAVLKINFLVVVSCIAFAFAAVMETFIQMPFEKLERKNHIIPTILQDLKEGFIFIRKENPVIMKIMYLAAGVNLFLSAFLIVGAPYVLRITMKSSDRMYAVGMALAQLATILGALSMGVFSAKMKLETIYKWVLAMAVFLLPMAFALTGFMLNLGFWPSFVLFSLFAVVIMMVATMMSIYVITEVQRKTPNAMLGKVMAITIAVAQCAMPLGQLLYGGAFELFQNSAYVPVLIACVSSVGLGIIGKNMLKGASDRP